MNAFRILVSAAALLTTPSLASGQAQFTLAKGPHETADTLVVVVLGSSTAAGSGATPRDSAWAYRYAEYLSTGYAPAKLINLARGGYTSYHLQPDWYISPADRFTPDSGRNISRALSYNPDAIIINLPSNDAARLHALAEQQYNFERIAHVSDSAQVPVWVTTTQPRNFSTAQTENLKQMRDWIVSRFGPNAIDFWKEIATAGGGILPLFDSGDGIHLNNAGHALLYERVVRANIPAAVRTTSVVSRSVPIPALFVTAVYPNPIKKQTTFTLQLTHAGNTNVTIHDVLGNVRRTVYVGDLSRGRHIIDVRMDGLPPAVYFYRVRSGKEVHYGKLLKIPG